ncbi:MAG TPA: hypothetical protein VK588_13420 [Chitinophagaceae bacterium]|nr:hypothetical protein [Chitinophagaceae bacterium]
MLTDFFRLNTPYITIGSQEELLRLLNNSRDLRDALYEPVDLKPDIYHPTVKIRETVFTNVSFSKTKIIQIVFVNCKFIDCLFIGAEVLKCEFQNCKFTNCNPYKIIISETYINPKNFSHCIKQISKANIAVHLFQQLLQNSDEKTQSKFTREAEYQFKNWQNKLTLNKFKNKQPYPISIFQFLRSYPINWLYKWTFGYGLRLRNFVVTFLIIFCSFYFLNAAKWKSYDLHFKDVEISSFNKDSSTIQANFLYTLDATTKIVDSQFQARSYSGMSWLTFQNIVGFILLSGLVTIIINRFVK